MKKLFALLALVAVAFTACNNEPATEYSSTLKPESALVEFNRSGGEKIVKFTIINPAGGSVTAEAGAEWLEAVVDFNSEVIITAEANEGDARESKVTLKYATAKDVEIIVKQRSGQGSEYDVEYAAERFEGVYWGKAGSTYNYQVILSDIGATLNGAPKANGTYYFFDFYSKVAGDEEYPVLPNGTYTLDGKNTGADATFADEASFYSEMNDKGEYATVLGYKSATVKVTDDKFEAIIEMSNGEIHKVTYEGDLYVGADNSTLTEDFTFDIEGATITATNYGDTLQMGLQSWFIEAVKGDDLFMIEFFTASSESPAGIYSAFTGATSESYENKFISGFIGESGLVGSWYAKLTNGAIKGDVMAPIAEGLVQVVVDGTSATINYSAKDDLGYKIEGSVSGSYSKAVAEE